MSSKSVALDITSGALIIDIGSASVSFNGFSMIGAARVLVKPTKDILVNTDLQNEPVDLWAPGMNANPFDDEIRKVVADSRSEAVAARALGMHRTTLRKHLDRLNIQPDFRIGAARLPPDPELKHEIVSTRNRSVIAKKYGVSETVIAAAAKRLKVNGAFKPRAGLPSDEILRTILERAPSVAEAAQQLGCTYHTASNQYSRLKITRPRQRTGSPRSEPAVMIDPSDVADLARSIVGSQAGWQMRFAKYIRYPQDTVNRWLAGQELIPAHEFNALRLRFGMRQLKGVA